MHAKREKTGVYVLSINTLVKTHNWIKSGKYSSGVYNTLKDTYTPLDFNIPLGSNVLYIQMVD